MSERKEGWYWVNDPEGEGWICLEWKFGRWLYGGSYVDHIWRFDDYLEIGPRIPTPDEIDYTQIARLLMWQKASANRSGMCWHTLPENFHCNPDSEGN